jgi:hypothetical protein
VTAQDAEFRIARGHRPRLQWQEMTIGQILPTSV